MGSVYIQLENVYSEILTPLNEDIISEIHDVCSYQHQTYDNQSGFKRNTLISLFNGQKKIFPTGLYQRIGQKLTELGYRVKLKDFRRKPEVDIDAIVKKMDDFSLALRDYQIEGGLSAFENVNGLFNWGTGAGKTVEFIFLLLAYDVPSLILVNRKELMEQISHEISKVTKRTVGTIGDGVWNPSKWTVGIVNSFNKGLNSNSIGVRSRTIKYLEKIEMLIGDEIHHLGAKTYKDVAKGCSNAYIRLGFSGTCFHPDTEDVYLVGFMGEEISKATPSYLVENGWLAQPKIYMPTIEPNEDILEYSSSHNWHSVRKWLIRENQAVNESGVNFIKKMYNKGISCIYFSGADIPYGKKINDMILDAGINPRDIRFMNGTEDTETRRKALRDFREKRFQILGGTSIYDEGIDVPHTGAGANFGQGLAEISTVQRIGRVLRKTKPDGAIDVDPNDKQTKYYWDPINVGNSVTEKHSEFRKSLYKQQRAFKVFEREYGKSLIGKE